MYKFLTMGLIIGFLLTLVGCSGGSDPPFIVLEASCFTKYDILSTYEGHWLFSLYAKVKAEPGFKESSVKFKCYDAAGDYVGTAEDSHATLEDEEKQIWIASPLGSSEMTPPVLLSEGVPAGKPDICVVHYSQREDFKVKCKQ